MVSKMVVAALCLVVAVAAVPPGIPSSVGAMGRPAWLDNMPWMPKWGQQCPLGTPVGSQCTGCSTKLICMTGGRGMSISCTGAYPYCVAGDCVATPGVGCEPAAVPATSV